MRSRRLCDVAAASLLLLASRYYVTPGSLSRLRAYATPRPQHRNHTGTFASLPPAAAGGAAGPPPRRPSFRNDTAVAPVDRRRPHRARAAPAAPAAPARVPFLMCDRRTPYAYAVDPASGLPLPEFRHDWPRRANQILLLRNDGHYGHLGQQVTSLLRAFDYARDHGLDLGILFHSWAMDTLQTMFYEAADFDDLVPDLRRDLGILVVRDQKQLAAYAGGVVSLNAEQLHAYRPAAVAADRATGWRAAAPGHAAFLRTLFVRHNRGYGYVHSGLRARDVCAGLDRFFHERAGAARYTVLHARYLDGNATGILERMASTVGLTVEGGALYLSPGYVKAILGPLGMLDYPVVLLSDGQLRSVERGLLNDPVLGPRLMTLSDRAALDGAEVALAVLADVFVGNPASATAGFVARARHALGYPAAATQLFRKRRLHTWYSVCDEECVFNPWIMEQWT